MGKRTVAVEENGQARRADKIGATVQAVVDSVVGGLEERHAAKGASRFEMIEAIRRYRMVEECTQEIRRATDAITSQELHAQEYFTERWGVIASIMLRWMRRRQMVAQLQAMLKTAQDESERSKAALGKVRVEAIDMVDEVCVQVAKVLELEIDSTESLLDSLADTLTNAQHLSPGSSTGGSPGGRTSEIASSPNAVLPDLALEQLDTVDEMDELAASWTSAATKMANWGRSSEKVNTRGGRRPGHSSGASSGAPAFDSSYRLYDTSSFQFGDSVSGSPPKDLYGAYGGTR